MASPNLIEVTTPEAAYVLGFLWGDGYSQNRTLAVECVKEDLVTLKTVFDAVADWKVYERSRPNRRPQMTLRVSLDPDERDRLIELGFSEKSTTSAQPLLDSIPEWLHPFWFRGYFDADGCFYLSPDRYVRHATLCADIRADLDFFVEKMEELGCPCKVERKSTSSRYSNVRLAKRESIRRWGEYLYADRLDIGLTRKRLAWEKSVAEYPPKNSVTYMFEGEELTINQISAKVGVRSSLIRSRLGQGWDLERAINAPPQGKSLPAT